MLYEAKKYIKRIIPAADTHFVVPSFPPPPYLNPTLLIHFNGPQDSTVFTDATGRHTVTTNGNAKIDTAQSVFGGASGFFDNGFLGTGTYLSLDGNADLAFGLNDFTIDFWGRVRDTTSPSVGAAYDSRVNTNDISPWVTAQGGTFCYRIGSVIPITGTTTVLIDTWYHVAVTRFGTTTRLFVNGVQEGGDYVGADNLGNGASRPIIGSRGNAPGASFSWDGWIDEMRVINGAAAWTANFAPPTQPYTVS